jgi:hypothetical protein
MIKVARNMKNRKAWQSTPVPALALLGTSDDIGHDAVRKKNRQKKNDARP